MRKKRNASAAAAPPGDPLQMENSPDAKRAKHGDLRFACGACGDIFPVMIHLDRHIKVKHTHEDGTLQLLFSENADFPSFRAGIERAAKVTFREADETLNNEMNKIYRCETSAITQNNKLMKCCPGRVYTQKRRDGTHITAYTKHYGHTFNKYTIPKHFVKYIKPNQLNKIKTILENIIRKVSILPSNKLFGILTKCEEFDKFVDSEIEMMDVIPHLVIVPEIKVADSESDTEEVPDTLKRKNPTNINGDKPKEAIQDEAEIAVGKAMEEYIKAKTESSKVNEEKSEIDQRIERLYKSHGQMSDKNKDDLPEIKTNNSPPPTLPIRDVKIVLKKADEVTECVSPKIVNTFTLNEGNEIDSFVKDVETLVNDGKGFRDEVSLDAEGHKNNIVKMSTISDIKKIVPSGIEIKKVVRPQPTHKEITKVDKHQSNHREITKVVKRPSHHKELTKLDKLIDNDSGTPDPKPITNETIHDLLTDLEAKKKKKAKVEEICPTPSFNDSYASYVQNLTKNNPVKATISFETAKPKRREKQKNNLGHEGNNKLRTNKKGTLIKEYPVLGPKIIEESVSNEDKFQTKMDPFLQERSKTKWQEVPEAISEVKAHNTVKSVMQPKMVIGKLNKLKSKTNKRKQLNKNKFKVKILSPLKFKSEQAPKCKSEPASKIKAQVPKVKSQASKIKPNQVSKFKSEQPSNVKPPISKMMSEIVSKGKPRVPKVKSEHIGKVQRKPVHNVSFAAEQFLSKFDEAYDHEETVMEHEETIRAHVDKPKRISGGAVKEKFIVKEQENDCNILIIRM